MNVRDYLPWLPKEVLQSFSTQLEVKEENTPNPILSWVSASQVM